jgi:hypothetical protein
MSCYSYETIVFEGGIFDTFVDASYVLTLDNSTRRAQFIKEISNLKPTKKTYVQTNSGYKKCSKQGVKRPYEDLCHAFKQAASHALTHGFKNVLIFEDDVQFTEYFLTNKEKLSFEIKLFFESHKGRLAYALGMLPTFSWYVNKNTRRGLGAGSHAIIYDHVLLREMRDLPLQDVDRWLNLSCPKYFHCRLLAYQLCPLTENMASWGVGMNVFDKLVSSCLKMYIRLTGLATHEQPGYFISYQLSMLIPYLLIWATLRCMCKFVNLTFSSVHS